MFVKYNLRLEQRHKKELQKESIIILFHYLIWNPVMNGLQKQRTSVYLWTLLGLIQIVLIVFKFKKLERVAKGKGREVF